MEGMYPTLDQRGEREMQEVIDIVGDVVGAIVVQGPLRNALDMLGLRVLAKVSKHTRAQTLHGTTYWLSSAESSTTDSFSAAVPQDWHESHSPVPQE